LGIAGKAAAKLLADAIQPCAEKVLHLMHSADEWYSSLKLFAR
jgi:hypothetical protein